MGTFSEQFCWKTLFEKCCLGTFPLRMGNTFISGYFRSIMGPVSHLVAYRDENNLFTELENTKNFQTSLSNNLIDVQQMKKLYNTEKQMIKLGLLNIRSISLKALFL